MATFTGEEGSSIYAKTQRYKLIAVADYANDKVIFTSKAERTLELFPHKHALPIRNLRVVTVNDAPFTMIHKHSDHILNYDDMTCSTGKLCWQYEMHNNTKTRIPYCCYGYCIELLNYLSEDLQLVGDIYMVEDSAYGQIVNGTWVGMVGDVVAGKADLILASLSINSKRAQYIDFSYPYMTGGVAFVVMEERSQLGFFNFESLAPLSIQLWLIILLITFLSSFLLVAMEEKCFVNRNQDVPWEDHSYPWAESITYLSGLVFQKDIAGKNPQYLSTRIISVMIALVMIIIMSTYTAILTASKVTHKTKIPITGLNDKKVEYDFTLQLVYNS